MQHPRATTYERGSSSLLIGGMLLALAACTDGSKDDIRADPGSQQQPEADASVDRTTPTDAQPLDANQPDTAVSFECKQAAGLKGPKMIAVPAPNGSTYCIDRTEVTQGQYQEFVEAKGGTMAGYPCDMSGQPAGCELNAKYVSSLPDDEPPSCRWTHEVFDPTGSHPEYPVACVDWCDAYMYCKWAGKRLCGAIGGGPIPWDKQSDGKEGEWYNACSEGGTSSYPYADKYDAEVCGSGTSAVGEVASERPDCHGTTPPFDQIVSMSGNLAEWTDNCEVTATYVTAHCTVRGTPGLPREPEDYACDASSTVTRGVKDTLLGFRCCLD